MVANRIFQYSLKKGDVESARRLVELTIQQCPKEAAYQGWDRLKQAELYEAEGKLDEAIQSYGNIAELRYPRSFFEAVLKIGDLYLEKGDTRRAVEAYQRVIRCSAGSSYKAAQRLKELGKKLPSLI